MAITNTIGSFFVPLESKTTDFSPKKMNYFQTASSGATTAVLKIIGSATTDNQYYITNLHVGVIKKAAAADVKIHVGGDIIGIIATATSDSIGFNFAPIGLMCGTIAGTTTATTTLSAVAGGSCTMYFVCQGYTRV